ncbi:Calcineurin-like phosphoesterase [Halomicrobium zhouii]|uniref:Calcineurin-like phosphoesterase n=1 Tax=Halomicrobium zhouii TaxID=767519 RepID=A0A1I6L277_9EURY|nr:metallophosphoesterase [Halomicrobium zhouii]SFR97388.1 Calcineurin-like phosphoesterase [Halomicrobium zhouii]
MANGDPIEPDVIADTYEGLSNLYTAVSRLADARESITGYSDSLLHRYAELINERRGEFGAATAARNQFSMGEYREQCEDTFATIETEQLTTEERQPLEWLGIVDQDETFHIPCAPRTGRRLPLWPVDRGLNVENHLLEEFTVPQQPLTIFHVSDTHLGYRNRTRPGGGGNTHWVDDADSLAGFRAVLERAIDEEVDAVIHTGDLFDHDVDQETLDTAVAALESLAEEGIPFYYILGDHDRLATGGDIPHAGDAMSRLESATGSETTVHCSSAGDRIGNSAVTVFGVDSTGIGFDEIQGSYTLDDWSPDDIKLDHRNTSELNILCLHQRPGPISFPDLIANIREQNVSLDVILLGHEHSPPFDGEWQTEINGVTVSYAGPTIPISSYFGDRPAGYNRIRIGSNGNFSVDRRTL